MARAGAAPAVASAGGDAGGARRADRNWYAVTSPSATTNAIAVRRSNRPALEKPAPAGDVAGCPGLAATPRAGLRLGGNLFDTATDYSGAPAALRTVPTSISELGGERLGDRLPCCPLPKSASIVAMMRVLHAVLIARRRSRLEASALGRARICPSPGHVQSCVRTVAIRLPYTSRSEFDNLRLPREGLDTNEKRSGSGRTPVVRRLVGKGVVRVGPLVRFHAKQAALLFPASWSGHRLNGADPLPCRLLQQEVEATLRRARPALFDEPQGGPCPPRIGLPRPNFCADHEGA